MPADRLYTRAESWAQRRSGRIAGINPALVALRTVRSSQTDRVSGLAAEMAFFALLSLIPALVALGAGLSFLERVVDPSAVAQGRANAVEALGTVFTPQVRVDIIEPLVDGLLDGERGGIALSGVVVALYLASRVFTATIRALDIAYNVVDRRGLLQQRLLALVLAVGGVVVVALSLVVAVVGPLLGTGQAFFTEVGVGGLAAMLWDVVRWPVFALVAIAFFTAVYRIGPNVAHGWRECLPGAVLGFALWLLVTLGFRFYLGTVGTPGAQFAPTDEGVALLGQVVGAVVAAVLWTFLSSVSLLVGGELNSEIRRARGKVGLAGTSPDEHEEIYP